MNFNSIRFGDKQLIDYLLVLKKTANESEIVEGLTNGFTPGWDTFTQPQIFCPYTENLVSSYIQGLTSPITGFTVYRERIGDGRVYKVADVSKDIISLTDYLISNNTEYRWTVVPLTEDEMGISMASAPLRARWEGISLTTLKEVDKNIYVPDQTWIFQEDIGFGDLNPNNDTTVTKTYAKYPKVASGGSNFLSTEISCRLANILCTTNEYESTTEMFNAWCEFVASGKPALLKDTKGIMTMVKVTSTSGRYIDGWISGMTDSVPQYYNISFSITEIGNVEDISIYELDEAIV